MKNETPTEHHEQMMLVQWFRRQYPDTRIFAVPNGGARSIRQGAALKCEGVSAGVPDLFVAEWQLFIELKRIKGGRVSPEQRDWLDYLKKCGYSAEVCNGFEED